MSAPPSPLPQPSALSSAMMMTIESEKLQNLARREQDPHHPFHCLIPSRHLLFLALQPQKGQEDERADDLPSHLRARRKGGMCGGGEGGEREQRSGLRPALFSRGRMMWSVIRPVGNRYLLALCCARPHAGRVRRPPEIFPTQLGLKFSRRGELGSILGILRCR